MYFGQPIKSKEEDAFERINFAKHLASLLVLPKGSPSIAIAIEGSWGMGKTSVLNLVTLELKKNDEQPIVVHFNPWLVGSRESLIEGFFLEFATSLKLKAKSKKANLAVARILKLAKFLSPIKLIPGVEPWGTLIEKFLDVGGESLKAGAEMLDLSLSAKKKDVEKAIKNLKKPVVIVVDDIDRLAPDEIRIIVQVIKAIGDFERVSYLLAYEPEPVIKALSFGDIYDGRRFLEKIVQLSYILPRIAYSNLKHFLIKHLEKFIDEKKLTLSKNENELLSKALNQTAAVRSLATPRDVERLLNKLSLSAPSTRDEVNFADLLLFEILDLKFPQVGQSIRREPEIYLQSSVFDQDVTLEDHVEHVLMRPEDDNPNLKKIKRVIGFYEDERDQRNIRSVLSFLFPNLLSQFNPPDKHTPEVENRICTKEGLAKLLHSGVASFTYSSIAARDFLKNVNERQEILNDLVESGETIGWFSFLIPFLKKYDVNDEENLLEVLLLTSVNANRDHDIDLEPELGGFLCSLIESIPEHDRKLKLLNLIARNEASLSLSENIVLGFLEKKGLWKEGKFLPTVNPSANNNSDIFSVNELILAKDAWLNSVRKVAKRRSILKTEVEPLGILFRWGQLNDNDYTEVQEYLTIAMNDETEIQKLVQSFRPNHNLNGIEKLFSDVKTSAEKFERINDDLAQSISGYLKTVNSSEKS